MKTIEIDGILYNLTPADEAKNKVKEVENTFYYGASSDDGKFEFCVLLNEEGDIWEGTQSVTYLPNKGEKEIWDNVSYLKNVIEFTFDFMEEDISPMTRTEYNILRELLKGAQKRGWI